MINVKIFSSYRIDLDSVVVESNILTPIRCGAVLANTNKYKLMGDDSGENISEKRLPFCEATVEYWAWKNCISEYKGVCHYRRFFAFGNTEGYRRNCYNQIEIFRLTKSNIQKLGITDDENIRKVLKGNQIVLPEGAKLADISHDLGICANTVEELWISHEGKYFDVGSIDMLKEIISELFPFLKKSLSGYLSGNIHRGFNCFVFKSEIYDEFCERQFAFLDECIKRKRKNTVYNRDIGYFSEIFFGIYSQYLIDRGVTCRYLPIVFVRDVGLNKFSYTSMRSAVIFFLKSVLPMSLFLRLKKLKRRLK